MHEDFTNQSGPDPPFPSFAKGTKSVEIELDLKDGSLIAKQTLDDDSKIAGAVHAGRAAVIKTEPK